MLEFLKHATGFCGEAHPSLLTLLASTPFVGYAIVVVKNKFRK